MGWKGGRDRECVLGLVEESGGVGGVDCGLGEWSVVVDDGREVLIVARLMRRHRRIRC